MHHNEDFEWKNEEATEVLEAKTPPNFHKVLTAHYRERLQKIVTAGLKYTGLYFFIRNHMRHHQRHSK